MANHGAERKRFLGLGLFVILSLSILTVVPNSSALVKGSRDRIENQIDQMEKYRSSIANTEDEILELSNGSTVAENEQNSQAFSSPRVKPENDHSSDTTAFKTPSSIDGLDADEEHTQVIAQQSGRSFTITSDFVQPGAGGLVAYEQHIRLSGALTTDGNLIVGTGSLQYVCKKIFYNVDGSLDTTNPRYTDISGTLPNNVVMLPDGAGMLLVNAADFNLGLPDGCGFFQNVPYTLGPNGGIFASGSTEGTLHTYEISVPNSQPSTNLHVVTPIGQIKPGDVVVLDVGYTDPDGDRLYGYEIVQIGGPTVNLEPGTPSFGQYQFTVPQVTEDTTFSFESTVLDGLMSYPSLTSAPSSLDILVSPDNHPPEAVGIASPNPVDAGETVTLDGTQSHDPDPDDSIVSYQWEQIDPPGGVISSSPTVQFTAPEVDTETTFRFGLTVRDSHDAFGLTTVDVVVKPLPCPPAASNSVTAQQQVCPTGDFSINCPTGTTAPKILRGSSKDIACTATSMQGFNSQIDLTCQPPSNQPTITCTLNPTSVTPPPNGNVPFTLTVSTAKSTPLGNHDIKVHGVSGAIQHSTSITIECDICFPPRTGAQTMSQQGLQFLETKEGNNHSPGINKNCGPSIRTNCHVTPDKYGLYQDSAGHCTQGIGHLVRKGGGPCTPKIISDYNTLFPGGMTQQDALALLATDVREAESHVNNQVKVELTQYQFDALVSFTFNVGGKNLKISNLLRDINNGNCDPATIQSAFLRFTRAGGDPNALVNRRTAEANLFNNGVY